MEQLIDRTKVWLTRGRSFMGGQSTKCADDRAVWHGPVDACPIRSGETKERALPAMMAIILALPPEERDKAIAAAVAGAERAKAAAVIITDDLEFSGLRATRTPFEYLPNADRIAQGLSEAQAEIYRQQRMIILLQKWRPWRVLGFGASSQAFINRLRELQLPDDDILAMLGGSLQPA